MESAQVIQPAELVPVATTAGALVWVPRLTLDAIRNAGGGELVIRVESPIDTDAEWLTIAQAAREHIDDVDGLEFQSARMRVKRAVERGDIESRGTGHDRRLDSDSFRAWRLAERQRNLARDWS